MRHDLLDRLPRLAPMITRRGLLRGVGSSALFAGIKAGPARAASGADEKMPQFESFPDHLRGKGILRVSSPGGAVTDAQRTAFVDYFKEHSGIDIQVTEGFATAKIKAQVDTRAIEWDVCELARSNILPLQRLGDYFEPLDYSVIDWPGLPQDQKYRESVALFTLATVMTYRTDAFDTVPTHWRDFFDTHRFPGPRNWMSGMMGIPPQLEGALLGDGVEMAKLYPLDVNRAFKSLDRIKDDITMYWSSGAQSAQLMADNETVLGSAWNGRITPLLDDHLPVGFSWNGAMYDQDHLAVLKGTPHLENAMKYIAFATSPIAQARFSYLIPYGYTNQDAGSHVSEARKKNLPSSHLDAGFFSDIEWWDKNRDQVIQQWSEWILS